MQAGEDCPVVSLDLTVGNRRHAVDALLRGRAEHHCAIRVSKREAVERSIVELLALAPGIRSGNRHAARNQLELDEHAHQDRTWTLL